jgi:hypothetical protein
MVLGSWFSHNAIHETYYSMGYMTSKKEKHNVKWRHWGGLIWYAIAANYLQQKERY